jgi:hypothetical protein
MRNSAGVEGYVAAGEKGVVKVSAEGMVANVMPDAVGHEEMVVVAGVVADDVEPVVVGEVPGRPRQRQHGDLLEIESGAPAAEAPEVPASGGGRQ